MDNHWFGRKAPEGVTVAAAWGARAIYHPMRRERIDLLPDRQQCAPDSFPEANHQLSYWLNHRALAELNLRCRGLRGDSQDVVSWDDGEYHIEASPQGSCGYLYIGAWLRLPDESRGPVANDAAPAAPIAMLDKARCADSIAELLSGRSWDSDTLEAAADILRRAGYVIEEPAE